MSGLPPYDVPDTNALRRRVLFVGLLSLLLFFGTAYTVTWLGVDDAWLVVAIVLLYLAVVRPLMHPVREAVKLRRRLAYDAWLAERGPDRDDRP